jgi:hypothetical protein
MNDKPNANPQGSVVIQVKGEDPIGAPPAMFSNFLAISRVASDVQLEFVFLDFNHLAQIIQGQASPPMPVEGQTIAKIIMPAAAFAQLKDHFVKLVADIEKEMAKQPGEVHNVASNRRATS